MSPSTVLVSVQPAGAVHVADDRNNDHRTGDKADDRRGSVGGCDSPTDEAKERRVLPVDESDSTIATCVVLLFGSAHC